MRGCEVQSNRFTSKTCFFCEKLLSGTWGMCRKSGVQDVFFLWTLAIRECEFWSKVFVSHAIFFSEHTRIGRSKLFRWDWRPKHHHSKNTRDMEIWGLIIRIYGKDVLLLWALAMKGCEARPRRLLRGHTSSLSARAEGMWGMVKHIYVEAVFLPCTIAIKGCGIPVRRPGHQWWEMHQHVANPKKVYEWEEESLLSGRYALLAHIGVFKICSVV